MCQDDPVQDMHVATSVVWVLLPAAERKMTMHKVWSLADAMCSQVRSQLSKSEVSTALNLGSREFLERSYREYMQSELRRHRNQVQHPLVHRRPHGMWS